jgi:uncharacterized membrane protein
LSRQTSGLFAAAVFLLGTAMTALCVQSVLSDATIAGALFSRRMWDAIATRLGATRGELAGGEFAVGFAGVWLAVVAFAGTALVVGGGLAAIRSRIVFAAILKRWAGRGWLWWLLPGAWELLRVAAVSAGSAPLLRFLLGSLPLWLALVGAGWLTALLRAGSRRTAFQGRPEPNSEERTALEGRPTGLLIVVGLCAVYVAVFVWMNWQMYFALNIPHGDSAMYEEHLWNTWHGKGFRSYLDDGRLFLGEHIQVVHLLLLPLHMAWPSQLLLELCESLALAAGAIPVFWMARRHTGSARCGVLLAAAFLLYAPLHYLDIAIDGKTFRPTAFGVTALLFALDQLERRRFRTMAVLMLVALSAKEDYAVMIACVGLWLASSPSRDGADSRRRWWGIGLAVFGAAYLLFVVKFAIPYFRGGDVHYARYFGELGSSPGDIVNKAFSEPGAVIGKLFSVRSALYVLFLLVPIGFLPLRSPGRLAVGLPWFGMLCLLELTTDPAQQGQQMLVPWHHFHAPLIPILFWSAAAGLDARWRLPLASRERQRPEVGVRRSEVGWPTSLIPHPSSAAGFALASALCSGVLLSFHPLAVAFWDPGSQSYWKKRYVVDERARKFAIVEKLVPDDARVFSTDFVHTRFTHHARSYDYSAYKRKSDEERSHPVAGEKYDIVIDTHSRYSTIHMPADVPEYRDHPDQWELLRHDAEEYFIVLRRRE